MDDEEYFQRLAEQWELWESDSSYAKWWSESNKGLPSSARHHSDTPPQKMSALALGDGDVTPPKVPLPMAKRQLQAAARVKREMKSRGKQTKQKNETVEQQEPPKSRSEKAKPKSNKSKKTPKKTQKDRRSHANGPMQVAMKSFIQKFRS